MKEDLEAKVARMMANSFDGLGGFLAGQATTEGTAGAEFTMEEMFKGFAMVKGTDWRDERDRNNGVIDVEARMVEPRLELPAPQRR